MPSSESFIEISKFSASRGDMYDECGSIEVAKAFMKNWNTSLPLNSLTRLRIMP